MLVEFLWLDVENIPVDILSELFPSNEHDALSGRLIDPVSFDCLRGQVFRIGRAAYNSSTVERLASARSVDPLSRESIDWDGFWGRESHKTRLSADSLWFSLTASTVFCLQDLKQITNEREEFVSLYFEITQPYLSPIDIHFMRRHPVFNEVLRAYLAQPDNELRAEFGAEL